MKLTPAQSKALSLMAEGVDTGFHHGTAAALVRRGLARSFGTLTTIYEYDAKGSKIKGSDEFVSFTSSWQITDAGREAIAD